MKFKCNQQEIETYVHTMEKQQLSYTVEHDGKGVYLVTGLNEEEFMEVVAESEREE